MPHPGHHVAQVACGEATEDRAVVLEDDQSCMIVVADGVGGIDHGGEAAELVVDVVGTAWREGRLDGPDAVAQVLRDADQLVWQAAQAGQATAVVVVVAGSRVFGASVGDSEAWFVTNQTHSALTAAQRSRPLPGSGAAEPVLFARQTPLGGWLLVSSDALFRRVPSWKACDLCRHKTPVDACAALIELVRLPHGKFSDDVSIVIARLPAAIDHSSSSPGK